MSVEAGRFYDFGPFRLDTEERLLFRDGERVELAPKVLDTLILLVENHEHLVTKDELIQRLWPETFVEESNLTFNVSTLRKVLGDDRNNGNRFIETVPKRGYRFIATVRRSEAREPQRPPAEQQPSGINAERPANRSLLSVATAVVVVVGVGGLIYGLTRPLSPAGVSAYRALTSDTWDKDILSPVLTDGARVYFSERTAAGQALASVSSAGGEVDPIPVPWASLRLEDISPDNRAILVSAADHLWRRPLPAGPPQQWPVFPSATEVSWSPDGQTLVFARAQSLYLAKADGSEPRKLIDATGSIDWPRFSPDGKVLRFTVHSLERKGFSLWEVRTDGSHLRPLLPKWSTQQCCGNWTPDGRNFFFVARRPSPVERGQIWAMREQRGLLDRTSHEPVQITHGSQDFFSPVSSPDGKQLFAVGAERRAELMAYDFGSRQFVRYLDGLSASWVSFSSKGREIAYAKYPDATLWVADSEGRARQLTFDPMIADGLSFAPDGKRVAFRGQEPGKPFKIRLISTDAREPQAQELMPEDSREEGIPTWSPDGTKIAFGDVPPEFGIDDGAYAIHVFDLQARTLYSLPGSKGLWSARWSPDGRYMAALTISIPEKLEIFEFKSGTWRDTGAGPVDNPTWSHDSKYVYYDTPGSVTENTGIFRVRVSDGTVQKVAGFGNLRRADGWWSGLTPNDEPLILRDIGTSEIYALDVDWP